MSCVEGCSLLTYLHSALCDNNLGVGNCGMELNVYYCYNGENLASQFFFFLSL